MKIELITEQTLLIEYERYTSWPNFRPVGSGRIGGLWRAHFLQHALVADDLACAAWRSNIPTEILKLLQQYVDCHAELVEMAQAVPNIFVRWAKWSPAFTLLAATYWIYRKLDKVPDLRARKEIWENLDPRDILQYTRSEPSKSLLRALAKIPAEHCYNHIVSGVREQWQSPKKRQLLRHLNTITLDTSWLLSCHPPILDPAIHQLAVEEPYFDEFNINHIIGDLANRRELLGLESWPYRNRIKTWEQLLRAYDRFLRKTNHLPERFGLPPIAGIEDDRIQIEAIQSQTALENEAQEMSNCIATFLVQIIEGRCHAYRLLKPERATVLLDQRLGRWSIAEAMIKGNQRQVRSKTWSLLNEWINSAGN